MCQPYVRFSDNKKASPVELAYFYLVPHEGFEPSISSLRGKCPGPLDECGAVTMPLLCSLAGVLSNGRTRKQFGRL
jgi:hypothetical protein